MQLDGSKLEQYIAVSDSRSLLERNGILKP